MTATPDAQPVTANNPQSDSVCRSLDGICVSKGPFYLRIRPYAVICKVLATFPLHSITAKDGRELKHRWLSGMLIYDFLVFMLVGVFFIVTSYNLIEKAQDAEDKYYLIIWLRFTLYAAGARNFIQFLLCHIYAHKYPQLLAALEEYFQGIGAGIVESRKKVLIQQSIPICRTLAFLIFLTASSYSFFRQFKGATWPATISYTCVNLWKELSMNMFISICAHLRPRFDEVAKELAKVRQGGDSDVDSRLLENLRLQYAALTNILGLLQKCFGMQLALNILFFVVDTIMQLFIFFVFTGAQNVFLLTLSVYYFIGACGMIFFIDRLERRTDKIIDELNAFELNDTSPNRKYQVQLFVSQVTARPIKITASGFCIINNTLIGALFGAIATYLIVALNFAPYIVQWTNATMPTKSFAQYLQEN